MSQWPHYTRQSREDIARRVASHLEEGWYVNLGIGMPTLVADYVPADKEVLLHSENGILAVGPIPEAGKENPNLINASKQPVTLLTGGCFMDQAESFAMVRGGHLDLAVLGAFQVSWQGDLANWCIPNDHKVPAVGGAMDLASSAKNIWVMMDLFDKQGDCKLVQKCTYPLTGKYCVSRIYADCCTLHRMDEAWLVTDLVADLDIQKLRKHLSLPLLMEGKGNHSNFSKN